MRKQQGIEEFTREHYTANAGTEDVKNLCELDTSWKIIPPTNNIHHDIRVADIQPVATRCNQHKDIAELMMRVIPVIQLPAHPIVPCKCAFAKNSFDIAQNSLVNKHPKVIEVAYRDDVETNPDLTGYQVITEQRVR